MKHTMIKILGILACWTSLHAYALEIHGGKLLSSKIETSQGVQGKFVETKPAYKKQVKITHHKS